MKLNKGLIIRVLSLVETLSVEAYELHATEDAVTVLYQSRIRVFPYDDITTEITLRVDPTDDTE